MPGKKSGKSLRELGGERPVLAFLAGTGALLGAAIVPLCGGEGGVAAGYILLMLAGIGGFVPAACVPRVHRWKWLAIATAWILVLIALGCVAPRVAKVVERPATVRQVAAVPLAAAPSPGAIPQRPSVTSPPDPSPKGDRRRAGSGPLLPKGQPEPGRGASVHRETTTVAPATVAFGEAEASLIIAGMYLGQAAIRHKGISDTARRDFEKYLTRTGIHDAVRREIMQALQSATSAASLSQGVTLIADAANKLLSAGEEVSPQFGKEAAKFGFNFGIVTMGVNGCMDMPRLKPDLAASALTGLTKVLKSPAFSTLQEAGTALPFPSPMETTFQQMVQRDVNTLPGCQGLAHDAALLSFYLWAVADEGPQALSRMPAASEGEFASRMSIRLAMQGFVVTIPGVPSKLPPAPTLE